MIRTFQPSRTGRVIAAALAVTCALGTVTFVASLSEPQHQALVAAVKARQTGAFARATTRYQGS